MSSKKKKTSMLESIMGVASANPPAMSDDSFADSPVPSTDSPLASILPDIDTVDKKKIQEPPQAPQRNKQKSERLAPAPLALLPSERDRIESLVIKYGVTRNTLIRFLLKYAVEQLEQGKVSLPITSRSHLDL